jgi:hypothetical protein
MMNVIQYAANPVEPGAAFWTVHVTPPGCSRIKKETELFRAPNRQRGWTENLVRDTSDELNICRTPFDEKPEKKSNPENSAMHTPHRKLALLLSLGALALVPLSPALRAEDGAAKEMKESVKDEIDALKDERDNLKEQRDNLQAAAKTATGAEKSKIAEALAANARLTAAVEHRIAVLRGEVKDLRAGNAPAATTTISTPAPAPETTADKVEEAGKKGALAAGEGAAVAGEKALEKTAQVIEGIADIIPGHSETLHGATKEMEAGSLELHESRKELRDARHELGGKDVALPAEASTAAFTDLPAARLQYEKALSEVPGAAKEE